MHKPTLKAGRPAVLRRNLGSQGDQDGLPIDRPAGDGEDGRCAAAERQRFCIT
jgi:hypothetical protein